MGQSVCMNMALGEYSQVGWGATRLGAAGEYQQAA